MNKINILMLALATLLMAGCHSHDHDTEDGHAHSDEHAHDDHGHGHGDDDGSGAPDLSYTIWTDKSELFVEFPALVVGEESKFLAHFSYMSDFKAVTKGSLTVSLSGQDVSKKVDAPARPGIFTPVLIPTKAGSFDLVFQLTTPTVSNVITIKNVLVYASVDEAIQNIPEEAEDPNEISLTKEQAWKMEFASAPVTRQKVYEVIKTGGQLTASTGDQLTIPATANGIVVFSTPNLIEGAKVNNGQNLFTIAGGNMAANNIEAEFSKARANFEKAEADYKRKKQLYESEAISGTVYEEALNAYELAKTEYNNIASNFSGGGKSVKASVQGYVTELLVQNGAYVTVGQPLAVISRNKAINLTARINQSDYAQLNDSITANFKVNGKTYSLANVNGRLLSYGKSVNGNTSSVTVTFSLENTGELLPGSFAEVWIKTNPKDNTLTIPVEALLEDYGTHSVIVQTSGEGFDKRNITLGTSDGQVVQVTSGLEEGERIVTKGAYQVKMASMSGQAPAHGHAH